MFYYLTIGAYSFDVMLKITNARIELLHDIEMYNMIMKGIRGGFTRAVKRYASSNHPSLPNYDPSKPDSLIYFYDVTGLYATVMLRNPLPLDGFRWISPDSVQLESKPKGTGYILEVDLKYPFNSDHSDYPLCPHHVEGKLTSSFQDRKHYVIHYQTLKQALSMGLILEKIHRAISFNESYWLEPYIKLNTDLRTFYSQDKTLSNFFKLQSNLIYGKSIEKVTDNLNKHFLYNNTRKLMRLVKQPTFIDRLILNENNYILFTSKRKVLCNKPICLGFSILDLSKSYMYDMYYNKLKKTFPPFDLIYTDNDSFALHIFSKSDSFTNQNFIHPSRLGLFKDISANNPILDFVTVRCKTYGYRTLKDSQLKNLPKSFNFENYKNILSSIDTLKIYGNYKRVLDKRVCQVTQNKSLISH